MRLISIKTSVGQNTGGKNLHPPVFSFKKVDVHTMKGENMSQTGLESRVELLNFRTRANIEAINIGDSTVYINLFQNNYTTVPTFIHDEITEDRTATGAEIGKHTMPIIEQLIEMKYIEPDLSTMQIGLGSLSIENSEFEVTEKINFEELYIDDLRTLGLLKKHGFINESSNIHFLLKEKEGEAAYQKILEEHDVNIVIKHFSDLPLIKDWKHQSIRIESLKPPTNQQMTYLEEVAERTLIYIAIPYTLDIDYLSVFLRLKKYKNIVMFYDTCIMHHLNTPRSFNLNKSTSILALSNLRVSCGAGKYKFYVNSVGDIYKCYKMQNGPRLGNIKSEHIENFKNKLKGQDAKISTKCNKCEVKYFCAQGCEAEYEEEAYMHCENIATKLTEFFSTPTFNVDNLKKEDDLCEYEYLCERNSIRVLLKAYGIEKPLGYFTSGFFMKNIDFNNDGTFESNFQRNSLDSSWFPILSEKTNSLDWDIIDEHLDRGYPVLASVDVYHMPYKKDTYYKMRHGAHSVILVEKKEEGYMVLDWYHPDYFYGIIPKEILTEARTSQNKKEQMSVFAGHPINASYQLVYIDRLPKQIDLSILVKRNLYRTAKVMLSKGGLIETFELASEKEPAWLKSPSSKSYSNAIESLFFLDLELRFMTLYYKELVTLDEYISMQMEVLLERVLEVKKTLNLVKSKLIVSMRRNKPIDTSTWIQSMEDLNQSIRYYCEGVLATLK